MNSKSLHSRQQVATYFGVHLSTIKSWLAQGLPREEISPGKYRYPLPEMIQWRRARDLEESRHEPNEKQALQNKLLSIKAELEGLKLAQAKGELVNPDDMIHDFGEYLEIYKRYLQRYEHSVPPEARDYYADAWREGWKQAMAGVQKIAERQEREREKAARS